MNTRTISTRLLPATLLLGALCLSGHAVDRDPPTDADVPTLDAVKALEGRWYAVDEDGRATEEVVSTYRVTAAGSAVLETLFPGTDKEMLTVYHQDGEQLVSTHYCVQGNQPSYVARAGEQPGDLVYECRTLAGAESHDEAHMHRGVVSFSGPDRYRTTWHMVEDGEVLYSADFTVVRRR